MPAWERGKENEADECQDNGNDAIAAISRYSEIGRMERLLTVDMGRRLRL
jgi:hypothetical protein